MFIHKILRGAQAPLYLPFALGRLRALGGMSGWVTQQYQVPGYQIKVTKGPGHYASVSVINTGGAYFEFFTTGSPVKNGDVVQNQFATKAYLTATVGVDVSAYKGAVVAKPQILKGKRFADTSQASAIERPAQVNLINEPASELTLKGPTKPQRPFPNLLYRSWAPMHSHTGLYTRNYSTLPNWYGGYDSNLVRDIEFDVPWQDGSGVSPVRPAYLSQTADWPRSCGVQTVTDPAFGSRTFAIYIDAFSQFWVFPTSVITHQNGIAQNVDPKYVQGIKPTLPAWALQMSEPFSEYYANNGDTGLGTFPETDWQVHPDGTKACAIVYMRTPVTFDDAYFSGLTPPPSPPDPTTDYETALGLSGYTSALGAAYPPDSARYQYACGLVESTIQIKLTGKNPEQFSLSGATTVLRDPNTIDTMPILCGYVWFDIPNPFVANTMAATRGDLCIVDMECFYDVGQPTIFFIGTPFVKNVSAGMTDVLALPGVAITDFDMKTLSFAHLVGAQTIVPRSVSLRSGYVNSAPNAVLPASQTVNYRVSNPAVVVYTFATLREVLIPTGMPPAGVAAVNTLADGNFTGNPATWRATQMAGATPISLNSADNWTTRSNIRQAIAYGIGYSTTNATPSTDDKAWWQTVSDGAKGLELIYIANPRFGNYVYAWQLNQLMQKSTHSILFAHPNGSWAYFDSSVVYNQFGVYSPETFFGAPEGLFNTGLAHYDTLTNFDPAQLSVAVFDRVHLELPAPKSPTPLDTSFIGLYNSALTSSKGANTITDAFVPMSANDFQPTFTSGSYNDTITTFLELKVEYTVGAPYYIHDSSYQGTQDQSTLVSLSNFNAHVYGPLMYTVSTGGQLASDLTTAGPGGGLLQMRLDVPALTGPGYTGEFLSPLEDMSRAVMSSPVMITT